MDLRRRFGVLKAALVKRLGCSCRPPCASNGWLGGALRADCKPPGFIPDAPTTSAKRRVGTGTDCRTGLRGDREYGSMACVCSRRAANSQKVISERQRSASALRPTSSEQSCVLQTLRAEVLLRRAYPSEPLVRNQIRPQISLFRHHRQCLLGAPICQNRPPCRND